MVILLRDTFTDYCLPLQLDFALCKTASGAGYVSLLIHLSSNQTKSNSLSHLDLCLLRSAGT